MTQPKVAELLEKLARIIPGIAGYQDREKRRDADRAVRAKAATEISRCRELLSEAMNDLSRSGGLRNLRVIGNLERLVIKFDRIEDEMRYAPSGYAGWFDREGIVLEDLERLYEYDLDLLSAAETLADYICTAEKIAVDPDWGIGLDVALQDMRNAFEGRRRALEGREAESE